MVTDPSSITADVDAAQLPRRDLVPLVLGAGLLLLFAGGVAVIGGTSPHVRAFQFFYLAGCGGWILLLVAAARFPTGATSSRRYWLAGAIGLRALLLPASVSDDVYRYVWEGRVQHAGFSPYLTSPADESLAELRNEEWGLINHPDHPGIYPPVAQLFFRAVTLVASTVWGMKLALVLCDVGVLILLARITRDARTGVRALVAYGYCPLVLTAIAVEGHLDSLMLLFCTAAMVAADRKRLLLAGAFVGIAASAKVVALALVGWIGIRKPVAGLLAIAVFALAFVPFAGGGMTGARNLIGFGVTGEPSFGMLPTLLGSMSGSSVVRWGALGAFAMAAVVIARKARALHAASMRTFEALLLALPVVHPWYFSWALCGRGDGVPIRVIAGAALFVVYYEAERMRAVAGGWSMPAWAPVVFWCGYLGVGVVVGLSTLRRPASRRASRSSS